MWDKLLEALKAAGDDRAKQAAAIQSTDGALFQIIFQQGHDVGYGKKGGELTAAQARLTALEGELTTAKTEVTKLKANPDVAALHTQYGTELAALRDTQAKERETLMGTLRTERKSVAKAALRKLLTGGDKRLVDDYADALVDKADVLSRIDIKDDGTRQVLQEGKAIPFAATDFDAALGMLAEELKGKAPNTLVLVGTDAGGGTGRQAAPATQPATVYQKIREDVAKTATVAPDVKPHGSFAGLANTPT